MRDYCADDLHTEIYGGTERPESISAFPQSKQLNILFCECCASSGIVYPRISSMLVAYARFGKPKYIPLCGPVHSSASPGKHAGLLTLDGSGTHVDTHVSGFVIITSQSVHDVDGTRGVVPTGPNITP